MDRTKIIEAIFRRDPPMAEKDLREILKRMSDTNLLAFAIDLGINTDEVLAVRS
jgi:hypothetical protein